jgi:hypothetical protein
MSVRSNLLGYNKSGAGAVNTITLDPVANAGYCITGILVGYSDDPSAAVEISITPQGQTGFKFPITVGGPAPVPIPDPIGYVTPENRSVVISAPGDGALVSWLSVFGRLDYSSRGA